MSEVLSLDLALNESAVKGILGTIREAGEGTRNYLILNCLLSGSLGWGWHCAHVENVLIFRGTRYEKV